MKSKHTHFSLAGTILSLVASGGAMAQVTLNWTGGTLGGNSNLTSTSNWDPSGTVPGDYPEPPNLVIANRVGDTGNIATLLTGSSFSIRSITFDNSAGRFNPTSGLRLGPTTSTSSTVSNILTFETPDITIMSAVSNADVTLNRFNTAGATQTYNLNYAGRGNINVDGTSSITFSEVPITGTGGFRKTGDGLLVLIGSNSFTGGLEIAAGTVSTSSNLNLGSGLAPNEDAVVINGGTLRYTNSSVITNFPNRGMKVGEDIGTIELTDGNLRLQNTVGNVTGEAGVLRRTGTAILSIEAGTTHTGGTLLESGQISLVGNSTLGGSGGAGIVISADAILRGSGTINGASTFKTGSVLMIDQMTSTTGVSDIYGNLLVNGDVSLGGAGFMFDLDTPSAADQLGVNGTIDIGPGLLDLASFTFTAGSSFGEGSYTLFESDFEIEGDLGINLTGMLSGYDISLGFSDDRTDLVLTAVPEPAAAMIGGIGMLFLLRRRQRHN